MSSAISAPDLAALVGPLDAVPCSAANCTREAAWYGVALCCHEVKVIPGCDAHKDRQIAKWLTSSSVRCRRCKTTVPGKEWQKIRRFEPIPKAGA